MKYIIIGLGNFGSALAEKLTVAGNEVIGVDNQMSKVESIKEKVSHAVCLDCTEQSTVSHLPLKNTDIVIVCIGEDEGANLLATALMLRLKVKRLISRAVSPLHETILEAMGVEEIVHPEEETASRWAKKLNLTGIIDSFELSDDFNIIEALVPQKFAGKTLSEVDFLNTYNVIVLTTIKQVDERNQIGVYKTTRKVSEIASSKTLLQKGDILVLYGKIQDIKRLLNGK